MLKSQKVMWCNSLLLAVQLQSKTPPCEAMLWSPAHAPLKVHPSEGGATVEGAAVLYYVIMTDEAYAGEKCTVRKSTLRGEARVYGQAYISDIKVYNNCHIFGKANLRNHLVSGFNISLRGECKFGGAANFEGLKTFGDFIKKYGSDKVHVVDTQRVVLTDVWDMG